MIAQRCDKTVVQTYAVQGKIRCQNHRRPLLANNDQLHGETMVIIDPIYMQYHADGHFN